MNEKLKSERTALLGINSKASPYLVGQNEFLDLRNLDFQTPGALTQRWGSTMYIGQTFAGPINSLYEFNKLDGSSMVFTSHSGGIWYGATTGQYQGLSLVNLNATLALTGQFSLVTNALPAGSATVIPVGRFYLDDPKRSTGITITNIVPPNLNGDNKLDYVTFQNRLYMADGNKFLKFDGTNLTRVGLPYPVSNLAGATANNAAAGTTVGYPATGVSGYFNFFISYTNDAGFESQIWPVGTVDNAAAATMGGSFIQVFSDVLTPLGYGISAVNVYSYFSGVSALLWSADYVKLATYPASGSTITRIAYGTTTGGFSNMFGNVGILANKAVNLNFVPGSTLTGRFPFGFDVIPYYPKYLELYKNRLFTAGFSAALSTVAYSDLAAPEAFLLDNNFEVRTNDGDYVSNLKAYSTRLYLFKKETFEALYGDNPSNFYLQEISQNYGALNNACSVIYNDLLVFLDRCGIMQYNGSALSSISDKINPIFDRMNYTAAVANACMVHDKLRNQILIGIPVDGSTLNNLTIVYDYLSGAWTYEDGFTPSVFAAIKGYNNTKNAFYGTPSGTINWFGPSFLADNGVGFTCMLKTSWFKPMGETVEEQYRRLYTNITPQGVTLIMPIKFYQDYGASVVQSMTVTQFPFQERTEFGIPSVSLSVQLFSNQTAVPLQITAISLESRLQRRVAGG